MIAATYRLLSRVASGIADAHTDWAWTNKRLAEEACDPVEARVLKRASVHDTKAAIRWHIRAQVWADRAEARS